MRNDVLFETLNSLKKMFRLQLESNPGLLACQYATLTTRPFSQFFFQKFLKLYKSIEDMSPMDDAYV